MLVKHFLTNSVTVSYIFCNENLYFTDVHLHALMAACFMACFGAKSSLDCLSVTSVPPAYLLADGSQDLYYYLTYLKHPIKNLEAQSHT